MWNVKNNYLLLYLSLIFIFATFWLYIKHSVGNDWGISEWIINYQGGFTRRGLPGEISYQISKFFDFNLRFIIFLTQTIFYSIYLVLIYNFFKRVKFNIVFLLAIYTPIFLFFHVAELESLARKEIFLFIGFIWFYNISSKEKSIFYPTLWIIFILPLICVLYEQTVFYFTFFAAVIIIKLRNDSLVKLSLKIITIFIPAITASWFSAFTLISPEGFEIMKLSLEENFGESCYGSCGLMNSKREALVHFNATINKLTEKENSIFIYLFRYFLIFLVGFAPLLILIKNSFLKIKILNFKGIIYPFLLLNIMIPIHWLMFIDWGRAVNITYVSSILFYFYLFKNEYIKLNEKHLKKQIELILKKKFIKNKRYIVIFIFAIYSFGWSPPTLLSADVNSFPGYRLPYKTAKYLFSK
jgi:hypothetical protein